MFSLVAHISDKKGISGIKMFLPVSEIAFRPFRELGAATGSNLAGWRGSRPLSGAGAPDAGYIVTLR